jgi:hypothetical protein
MQHGMTRFGILFPKGADDHAHFILPEGSRKGIGSPGKHLHAPLDLHGCGGRKVDSRVPCPRYKRVRGGACTSPAPPESRFDPKVQ